MFFAHKPRRTSFGLRLALFSGGVLIASIAVLLAVQSWIALHEVHEQLGDALQSEARILLARGPDAAIAAELAEREDDPRSPFIYILQDAAGQRLAGELPSSPNWRAGLVDGDWPPSVPRRIGFEETTSDRIVTFGSPTRSGGLLVVGIDGATIDETEDALWQSGLWGLPLAAIFGFGGAIAVSRRYHKRVEAVSKRVEAVMGDELSVRIPLDGSGDEIDRLAGALNAMLDRLADSTEGLRQVSTDIAHELRTPLSRLLHTLDAATNAPSHAATLTAIEDASREASGLLETFSALLRIAQVEGGQRRYAFASVDLSNTIASLCDAYYAVAEDCGHFLKATIDRDVMLDGDRDLLMQLFANLLENALRHTPPGTQVLVTVRQIEGEILATVEDNGPGIPTEERQNVVKRLYRLESSRTTPGAGLGLAMVVAIAQAHTGSIVFESADPGLRVIVRLPTSTGSKVPSQTRAKAPLGESIALGVQA